MMWAYNYENYPEILGIIPVTIGDMEDISMYTYTQSIRGPAGWPMRSLPIPICIHAKMFAQTFWRSSAGE